MSSAIDRSKFRKSLAAVGLKIPHVGNGNTFSVADSTTPHAESSEYAEHAEGSGTASNSRTGYAEDRPGGPIAGNSSDGGAGDDKYTGRAPNGQPTRSGTRAGSGTVRFCGSCKKKLSGQFVRALNNTFHLECLKCYDCGKVVANQFFPVADPADPSKQIPLCERDYFRRVDLLCDKCGGALRGSYITALNRKYHIEHFTCSICTTAFGAQDSYYEHEGQVYCHYHYSTLFALRCSGCDIPILKQFVEIMRNGQKLYWHPECYMIQKFWNVRLASSHKGHEGNKDGGMITAGSVFKPETMSAADARRIAKQSEDKVFRIWSVLSTFEESSAACISDMLLHVSNGSYVDGTFASRRFIAHVKVLFEAIDQIDSIFITSTIERVGRSNNEPNSAACDSQESSINIASSGLGKGQISYGREAKLLCRKVVAFFDLLVQSQDGDARKTGISQELLSVVTGLAHYLKLLIRTALTSALRAEREFASNTALKKFLSHLDRFHRRVRAVPTGGPSPFDVVDLSAAFTSDSDTCAICSRLLEDHCVVTTPNSNPTTTAATTSNSLDEPEKVVFTDKRVHYGCLECRTCHRFLRREVDQSRWDVQGKCVRCSNHMPQTAVLGFTHVTKLSQYVYLLWLALVRLHQMLETTSSDDKLQQRAVPTRKDVSSGRRSNAGHQPSSTLAPRSPDEEHGATKKNYMHAVQEMQMVRGDQENTVHSTTTVTSSQFISEEVTSAKMSEHEGGIRLVSSSDEFARPYATAAQQRQRLAKENAESLSSSSTPQSSNVPKSSSVDRFLTLDDIPRLLNERQDRQLRPNAYQHMRSSRMLSNDNAKTHGVPRHLIERGDDGYGDDYDENNEGNGNVARQTVGGTSSQESGFVNSSGIRKLESPGGQPLENSDPLIRPRTRYFSELSALEVLIVRHIAIVLVQPLVKDKYSMEDLLDLIEVRKGGFWEKFGKAFKGKDAGKKDVRKTGVFGVALDTLTERDGTESTQGQGSGNLAVPSFIEDVLLAMRQKDMTVEGVFRKNGNIRRLRELTEKLDNNPQMVNLDNETPVQLAALLKKFFRSLPDPLLTYKLHKIWIHSASLADEQAQLRLMHLLCCILPKCHRDTMEVLFNLLYWASSFSEVGAASGSKMDLHNIATVMAPNILFGKSPESGRDDHFLAIETVHTLLEYNNEFSMVPADISVILQDSSLLASFSDLSPKDLLKRCEELLRQHGSGANVATSAYIGAGSVADEAAVGLVNESPPTRSRLERPRPALRVNTQEAQEKARQTEATVRSDHASPEAR